jgi:hypothetical protein
MSDSLSILSEAPRPRDLERLESRITGATRRLSELQAQLAAANIECQSWRRAALRATEQLSDTALELDRVLQVAADRAECIDALTAAVDLHKAREGRRTDPIGTPALGRRATDILPQCPPTCACRGQLP